MVQRRKPPARPAKPSRPRSSGGAKVSGSVSVSPRFTLFGGSLFSFSFGGGGRRARGKGGLVKRLAGLISRGYREVTGKGSGPSAGGKGGGRSFDDFKASRPELFEADDVDDQGDTELGDVPDHGGRPGGPTTQAHCPDCGHAPGTGHDHACPTGWHL